MSNSDMMMVNPGEIIIDMPVDEQNVLQKMESMKANGIIQPITLWLHGMRVIDGFHRVVAAQRLGWTEIPCYVIDCSEDAFWDARIQSARQHHQIADDRLTAWIFESWKLTKWHVSFATGYSRSLLSAPTQSAEMIQMAEQLWNIFRKETDGRTGIPTTRKSRKYQELISWLDEKAKMWGATTCDVAARILDKLGIISVDNEYGIRFIDSLAKKYDLTFAQRQKVVTESNGGEIVRSDTQRGLNKFEVEAWVKQEIDTNKINPLGLLPFVEERSKRKQDYYAQRDARMLERDQTPEGKAVAHKRNVEKVKAVAADAISLVKSVSDVLLDTTEFSDPIIEVISTLTAFHGQKFKSRETRMSDRLATRNAELSEKVKILSDEVASLKRALNAKQVVTPKLKNVMVEHSQEGRR